MVEDFIIKAGLSGSIVELILFRLVLGTRLRLEGLAASVDNIMAFL